jgi:hypothetical protein
MQMMLVLGGREMLFRGLVRALATPAFLLLLIGPLVAGPLEDADAANQKLDYATALRLLLPLGAQGSAGAQRRLGEMYESGRGVAKDDLEAEKWFRRAAAQNDLDAEWYLGFMYHHGRKGIPKDFSEADKWYRAAAEQGHILSQTSLASAYKDGDGVLRDAYEAAKWFVRAANQGDFFSQGMLGDIYESGDGVPQDYVMAYMWHNVAASHPLPSTSSALNSLNRAITSATRDLIAKQRDRLTQKMTKPQIAEAQKLSREWKPKLER